MDPILKTINDALKKKGLSDAAASQHAVGHPALIKKLRLPARGEKRYNYLALEKLADVLDLELYFGPPRPKAPVPPVIIDSHEYLPVPQYDAHLSAGDGVFNLNAEPIDHLAFSKTWMARHGLKAGKAILVSVRGDSMQPAICDGDLVLIDRQKTEIDNGRIYAFNDIGGDAKIKRLELIPGTALALRSDNPNFATLYRKGNDMNFIASGIIGRVVWVGHDLK